MTVLFACGMVMVTAITAMNVVRRWAMRSLLGMWFNDGQCYHCYVCGLMIGSVVTAMYVA